MTLLAAGDARAVVLAQLETRQWERLRGRGPGRARNETKPNGRRPSLRASPVQILLGPRTRSTYEGISGRPITMRKFVRPISFPCHRSASAVCVMMASASRETFLGLRLLLTISGRVSRVDLRLAVGLPSIMLGASLQRKILSGKHTPSSHTQDTRHSCPNGTHVDDLWL